MFANKELERRIECAEKEARYEINLLRERIDYLQNKIKGLEAKLNIQWDEPTGLGKYTDVNSTKK